MAAASEQFQGLSVRVDEAQQNVQAATAESKERLSARVGEAR